jgi:transitional endoplasmic reticulum ATPase
MNRWTLPSKINKLLLKNDRKGVLYILSQITALNSPLLAETDEDYLRYVGHFRIQMLMQWGMFREALAWACLETELYPDNFNNLVLKENLKRRINNIPKELGEEVEIKSWKDVAGMYELKAIIERDIILPLKEKHLYKKFGVSVPRGFMFYGPPGCGKTFIANQIANRIGFDFMEIKTSDIASTFVHGTQIEIRRVFDEARARAPIVLFFDEIESMVPARNRTDVSHHYKSEVNEFLGQLEKREGKEVIIIGATNYLNEIDQAILRPGRFDKKIFIGPPDYTARAEGFRLYLKDFPQENVKYDIIAELTEYFTFADILLVCDEIKREAIARRQKINTDFIGRHVSNYKPRLNEKEIQQYFF